MSNKEMKEKEPLSESFIAFVIIFLFIIFSALSQPCKADYNPKTETHAFNK